VHRPIWFEIEIHGKPAGIQKRYEGISGIDLGNKIGKRLRIRGEGVATVTHPLYPNALDTRFPASSEVSRPEIIRAHFPSTVF
jgi:hypothetical protein